jgi:transposase
MLSFPPTVRIHVARECVDLRKGFDGLCGLIRDEFDLDPLSGHFFVFFNRRRTHTKIMHWDRSGFWIYYKRLEKGTFELPEPASAGDRVVRMKPSELALILDGIELRHVKRRRRYDYVRPE